MSAKGSHRLSFAKHVYLRTQQRRLRHVKSIVVRNLSLEVEDRGNPLDLHLFFTIHPLYDVDKTLYRSETISLSYNPSWESVQFTTPAFGKHASLSMFTVKVWAQPTPSPSSSPPTSSSTTNTSSNPLILPRISLTEDKNCKLVFEQSIDMSELVYLGTLLNKDGSGYPTNSLVIGMFEGYYGDEDVGGTQTHPPIAHSLVDLLPPCSLLEVPRSEVQESYLSHTLQRILSRQEVLNKATVECNSSKVKVQGYLREQGDYFAKKREKESLKMRVALLQRQIQQQERVEKEESENLRKQRERLDSFEEDLRGRQGELKKTVSQYESSLSTHRQNVEKLDYARKSCLLRQRNMVYELSQAFFIKEKKDVFTICNVILPNADQLDQTSSMEQFGVALGFAAHLVSHLSRILLVPLQYPIKPSGSRSTISDHISEETIIDTIKEFPLYLKGSEKALFLYAVHLLNKDIGQIRQHCGFGASRSMLKKTLPNLKYLMDELIKDFFVIAKPLPLTSSTRNPTRPIDATAINTAMMQNGRFRDYERERLSLYSSRSSSLATTATMGLSLTPPTPDSLPVVAADHENFHSMLLPQEGRARQQPVASIPEGLGVEGESEGDLVDRMEQLQNGNGNGSLEGMEQDLFRPRSSHVAGGQHGLADMGQGGSSHEQLHYSVSVESGGGGGGGLMEERQRRKDSEQPSSQDQSPTPTPPSSVQERYTLEHNINNNKQQQHNNNNRHGVIHFTQQQTHHKNGENNRESSPAGTGLFVPGNSSEHLAEDASIIRENEGTPVEPGTLRDEQFTDHRGLYTNGGTPLETFDPEAEVESILEFSKVPRSSQLVDARETLIRRARAESREHNLPPPPHPGVPNEDFPELESLSPGNNNDAGSVSFTASGFSRLSPASEFHEIRASTPTEQGSNVQVPQVFVQRPFSPASGSDENHITPISQASLASNKETAVGGSQTSPATLATTTKDPVSGENKDSVSSWSSLGIAQGEPPSSGSLADGFPGARTLSGFSGGVMGTCEGGVDEDSESSPPLMMKHVSGGMKEVELTDINTFPQSDKPLPLVAIESSRSGQKEQPYNIAPLSSQLTPATSTITPASTTSAPSSNPSPPLLSTQPHHAPNPALSPSPPLLSTQPRHAPNSAPNLAPSPSPPLVSFTSFPHSPNVYKSSVATPHVLGMSEGPEDTYRPRARSNRVDTGARPTGLRAVAAGARSRSHSDEGKTEFLEDFVDNF